MVKVFNETISKENIVASPVDVVLDGVIISIDKGQLKEFIDEQYHKDFDNLDQEQLHIQFETKFNDILLKGNDRFAYYKDPMSNTKIGQFVSKYSELKVGVPIKVAYNGKGFGKILVK